MKRVCKDCLHFDFDEGRALCLFHNCTNQCIGCDDFWPKDRNPRCDECRFAVMHDVLKDCVLCYHTSQKNHFIRQQWSPVTDSSFCENWRARG